MSDSYNGLYKRMEELKIKVEDYIRQLQAAEALGLAKVDIAIMGIWFLDLNNCLFQSNLEEFVEDDDTQE